MYREFKKSPNVLYSIIFINFLMCLYGFWVSYIDDYVTLCILWSLLFVFSSLNQGHVLSNAVTRIGDISCAVAICVLYCIMYRINLNFWHILSAIIAITLFLTAHIFLDRLTLYQYVVTINLWHMWVIVQVWSIRKDRSD